MLCLLPASIPLFLVSFWSFLLAVCCLQLICNSFAFKSSAWVKKEKTSANENKKANNFHEPRQHGLEAIHVDQQFHYSKLHFIWQKLCITIWLWISCCRFNRFPFFLFSSFSFVLFCEHPNSENNKNIEEKKWKTMNKLNEKCIRAAEVEVFHIFKIKSFRCKKKTQNREVFFSCIFLWKKSSEQQYENEEKLTITTNSRT